MAQEANEKIRLSEVISQAQAQFRGTALKLVRWFVEMTLERYRDQLIGGQRYERGKQWKRYGYRNRKGYQTSWGWLEQLKIPRLRGEAGEVSYLERFERYSQQVAEAVVGAVVGGMSLRRLQGYLAYVFGDSLSWVALGKMVERLGERLEIVRQKPLKTGEYVGLVVDGLWGHLRRKRGKVGTKPKRVVAVAVGIRRDGSYEVLDWEAGKGEGEELYERLLQRLYDRGLEKVEIIVSDNLEGIRQAVATVYPEASLQLCLWHFGRQLERAIGSIPWWQRLQFRHQYWRIWRANDRHEAQQRLVALCLSWQRHAPQMVKTLKEHQCYLFTHYRYPGSWRHRVRTTNLVEGYFHHLRRYLQRYPGWMSDQHIERIVLLHLFALPSLFSQAEIPLRAYNTHPNFNTTS